MYAIYPGSEKIDLGPKRVAAICSSKEQAEYLRLFWGPHGYWEEYNPACPPQEVRSYLFHAGFGESPHDTPLCGHHAEVWFCERQSIKVNCIFCHQEALERQVGDLLKDIAQ